MAHGQAKKVDATRHVLTLSSGQELTVASDATVTRDGAVVTLKDVQQGDDVWASFTPGTPPTVEGLDAEPSARQVMDGIPSTNHEEFLHETWTSGG